MGGGILGCLNAANNPYANDYRYQQRMMEEMDRQQQRAMEAVHMQQAIAAQGAASSAKQSDNPVLLLLDPS